MAPPSIAPKNSAYNERAFNFGTSNNVTTVQTYSVTINRLSKFVESELGFSRGRQRDVKRVFEDKFTDCCK